MLLLYWMRKESFPIKRISMLWIAILTISSVSTKTALKSGFRDSNSSRHPIPNFPKHFVQKFEQTDSERMSKTVQYTFNLLDGCPNPWRSSVKLESKYQTTTQLSCKKVQRSLARYTYVIVCHIIQHTVAHGKLCEAKSPVSHNYIIPHHEDWILDYIRSNVDIALGYIYIHIGMQPKVICNYRLPDMVYLVVADLGLGFTTIIPGS